MQFGLKKSREREEGTYKNVLTKCRPQIIMLTDVDCSLDIHGSDQGSTLYVAIRHVANHLPCLII